jgi:8-oxo-dGTP diphosphatase
MNRDPPILVTAGVTIRDGKVLVAKRNKGSHLEGLWEFPGGKLEPNESPEECLAREFREELGVDIQVGKILEVVYHRYPEKNVLLLFYSSDLVEGEPKPLDVAELAWVPKVDLLELDWVPADIPFVKRLMGSGPKWRQPVENF